MEKRCIQSEDVAPEIGCDLIFGKKYDFGNMPDYWGLSAIYNTDAVSALYKSSVNYNPWDFLQPFSTSLWILIMLVLFLLTPLVMSIVEYDEGETVLGNFVKFLPDSIHAHTGVDVVNNDLPTKNTSYILSVFVSIFSFVTIALYATNLTAFVLYKSATPPTFDIHSGAKIFVESSVHDILPFDTSHPIDFDKIPDLHNSGNFDYIIAENYVLRGVKTCDDSLAPLKGVGVVKHIYAARKFGEENLKNIAESILAIDFQVDPTIEYCDKTSSPIQLSGIYGLFIIFLVPAAIIACVVVIRYMVNRKKGNQYITNSP